MYIENYRSIKKLDLKFGRGKNIIVGKNNSGKSNIIRAIDLILGEKTPTWEKSENITDNDFFKGETGNDIFIWCELIKENGESLNLTGAKGAFFKLKDSYNSPDKKMVVDFSNKDNLFEFSTEEGQARIDDNEFRKEWIGTRSYCRKGFYSELKDMTNFAFAFRCKKENEAYIKQLLFLYKKLTDMDWFFGLNANLRNELLQSAIIPSFRDPKDQLRITNYTWYGKLLKDCVKKDDK
ncbi:MAG: AAA family ATPase, partial [Candidatus Methanoperedens sp.]|nr:AAA family ATPase [Candidatus Methanoperedens sp.]